MDIEKVDPALRTATEKLPASDPSKAWMRAIMRVATRLMPVPRVDGVTVSTVKADGVRLRVYRPLERKNDAGMLWIHGGGLLFGDARQDEAFCADTARELGIAIVSANYRFAPDHPFPAALDDVRTAWGWMQDHGADLGVDPARLAVGGASAGGGLAASLAQRLHDEGGVQPVAQWLFAPMIDDRTATNESLDALEHWVWNNTVNRVGWRSYLGADLGREELPQYAAAARRTDLSGLPPTYIAVGSIELFLAEDQEYAHRLQQAGVSARLQIVPGAPHGFENWAYHSEPAKALVSSAREWLQNALTSGPPDGQ